MVGHRSAAVLNVVVAMVLAPLLLAGGCRSGHAPFARPTRHVDAPPSVGTVDAKVSPAIAEFGAFEVAVLRPTGDGVAAAVLSGFREGLYDALLGRGYSPLALLYVDAAGAAALEPGRTFPLRAHVTEVLPAVDGGYLVSGWAGLVAPRGDGGEDTLYVSEITRLAVLPQKGPAARDGGAATGRRLAAALLQHLPAR